MIGAVALTIYSLGLYLRSYGRVFSRRRPSRPELEGRGPDRPAPRSMNIEVVTIGDELLLGFTIDTNAAYLARELGGVGVSRSCVATTVGDDGRRDRGRRARGARPHRRRDHDGRARADHRRSHEAGDRRAVRSRHAARRRAIVGMDLRTRCGSSAADAGEPPEAIASRRWCPRARRCSTTATAPRPASGSRTTRALGRDAARRAARDARHAGRHAGSPPPRAHRRRPARRAVAHAAYDRHRRIAARRPARRMTPTESARCSLAYLPSQDGVDLRLTVAGCRVPMTRIGARRAAERCAHRLGDTSTARTATDLAAGRARLCRERGLTHRGRRELHRWTARRTADGDPGSSDVVRRRRDRLRQRGEESLLGVDPTLSSARRGERGGGARNGGRRARATSDAKSASRSPESPDLTAAPRRSPWGRSGSRSMSTVSARRHGGRSSAIAPRSATAPHRPRWTWFAVRTRAAPAERAKPRCGSPPPGPTLPRGFDACTGARRAVTKTARVS